MRVDTASAAEKGGGTARKIAEQVSVLTRDGVRLAVRDSGPRTGAVCTVVLLHGWCLRNTCWAGVRADLRRRYGPAVRVIAPDHRGHGRSSDAALSSYRLEQLALDLADVLTALGVTGPVVLGGHSLGGMVALTYLGLPARQRPVEPAGLVLIATAAGRLAERGLGRLLAAPALGVLVEILARTPHHGADQVVRALVGPACRAVARARGLRGRERATLAAAVADAVHTTALGTAVGFLPALKSHDVYPTLGAIAIPAVVVSGGLDLLTPIEHAHDLVSGITGALHFHIPGAGHMLLCDAPKVVSAAFTRMIQTVAVGYAPVDSGVEAM